jgi:DNA-binding CsgD family transcriptional regulator
MIMDPLVSCHQSTASSPQAQSNEIHRFVIEGQELVIVRSGSIDAEKDIEVCSFPIGSGRYSLVLICSNEAHDHEQIASNPDLINPHTEASADTGVATLLTARELQIASLVAMGHSNKQISRSLQISEWTVNSHLRRIFLKLGVDSRAAMVFRCASLLVTTP